jgi:hypothetical protein
MLFFKKLSAREYTLIILDYSWCEVVGRYLQHPDSRKRPDDDGE